MLLSQALLVAALCEQAVRLRIPPRVASGCAQALIVIAALATAWQTTIPRVDGFDAITEYVMQQADGGAFFYDGEYHGSFVLYVWMADPQRQHRVAVGHKTVYAYARTPGWKSEYFAKTPEDVVRILRQNGCRWIALENGSEALKDPGARLIREAAKPPDMEFVRRFPVQVAGIQTIDSVDLYRLSGPIEQPEWIELPFPILGPEQNFRVRPIPPRGG
jgi:hypothetical protein